jgi:S-adenosylmethionine-diacylglycerol 3-amino-3-carboxypropyl transferase
MKIKSIINSIQRFEFEKRIFISLGIVLAICLVSFLVFADVPSNMILVGNFFGLSPSWSVPLGFGLVAGMMVLSSLLRMWAGTVLSSPLVMSFKIQKEILAIKGPFMLSRNPIYLADMMAYCSFAICFTPIGLLLPVLLYLHYSQLISYEEKGLKGNFGIAYDEYMANTPKLIPNIQSLKRMREALKGFQINRDGFRHNALYILLIPGFIVAAYTGNFFHAILIGIPGVIDWAIVHTRIGLNPDKARRENQSKEEEAVAALKQSSIFNDIIYAQCWEDPLSDIKAFKSAPDGPVFSITSGGCNSLAFLTEGPPKITALDLSPYQNYLLDLKMAAFKALDYKTLLEFMGVLPSEDRLEIYSRLRKYLKPESADYWKMQDEKIKMGIIYCGRYEKYMKFLRKWLKWLIGKNIPDELFACKTKEERLTLYNKKWNNLRWRIFTKIFLSRSMMTLLFTGRFFDQLEESFSFGEHFRSNIRHAITELPLRENNFLAFILLGKFYSTDHLPFYLQKENFDMIKSRINRIEIITGDSLSYFRSLPSDSISMFNFSNIFEWIETEAHEEILKETIRVAKHGAIITYRNLLVPRSRPETLAQWIVPDTQLSKELLEADLSFIYRAFIVEKINKI